MAESRRTQCKIRRNAYQMLDWHGILEPKQVGGRVQPDQERGGDCPGQGRDSCWKWELIFVKNIGQTNSRVKVIETGFFLIEK